MREQRTQLTLKVLLIKILIITEKSWMPQLIALGIENNDINRNSNNILNYQWDPINIGWSIDWSANRTLLCPMILDQCHRWHGVKDIKFRASDLKHFVLNTLIWLCFEVTGALYVCWWDWHWSLITPCVMTLCDLCDFVLWKNQSIIHYY